MGCTRRIGTRGRPGTGFGRRGGRRSRVSCLNATYEIANCQNCQIINFMTRTGNDALTQKALGRCRGLLFLNGRNERIRTSDPLLPKQVRYQAALHSGVYFFWRANQMDTYSKFRNGMQALVAGGDVFSRQTGENGGLPPAHPFRVSLYRQVLLQEFLKHGWRSVEKRACSSVSSCIGESCWSHSNFRL